MADGQDKHNTANSDDIKNLLAQLKQSFDLAETPIPEKESEQTTDAPIMNEEEFEKLEEALVREGMLYSASSVSPQEKEPEVESEEEAEAESEEAPVEEAETESEEAPVEEPVAERSEPVLGQLSIFEAEEPSAEEAPKEEGEADLEEALSILDSAHRIAREEAATPSVEEVVKEEPAAPRFDSPTVETDWESFLQGNLPQAEDSHALEEPSSPEQSPNEERADAESAPSFDIQPEFLKKSFAPDDVKVEEKQISAEPSFEESNAEEKDAPSDAQQPTDGEDGAPLDTEAPTNEETDEEEATPAEKAVAFEAAVPHEPTVTAEKTKKAEKEAKPKEHWYVPDFVRIKERTDRYCDKHLLSLTVRFWLSLLPMLCLLVFENYDIFGTDFVMFANVRTAILVNLLLLAVSAGLVFPELKNGVLALFNRRTTSESFLAVGIVAVVLYDLILLLMSIGGAMSPRLIALVPAASVCLYLNTHRRYARVRAASIHSISDGRPMVGLVPQFANLVTEEKKALGKLVYEDSLIARTREVRRVDGVNARLRAVCEDARPNNVLLIVALSLSLIAGLVMGIVKGSAEGGLLSFCFALFLMIPGALLYTRVAPISRACRRALDENGVILGESSVFLYSELGAVSFEDIAAFPAAKVKVCKIKLFNRNPLDRVLCSASGVFSLIGGPLSGVFRESVVDIGTTEDVQILSVREDGILARVDGAEMRIGTGAYMQKAGVELPFDAEDEIFLAGGKVSILYASFGDLPCAKFYLRYSLDRGFVKTVQNLYKNGICTVLRTYDPNINNRLISKIGSLSAYSVKVVHKTEEQLSDFVAESADSGILSHTDAVFASKLLFLCINAVRIMRSNVILKIAMTAISAIAFLLLQIVGFTGSDYSLTTVLYQLLWLIPVLTAARLYIK